MGLPNIIIDFKTMGISAIKRGDRGIVAVIIKDNGKTGAFVMDSINDIPEALSADNKAYIQRAFIGASSVPKKVTAFALEETATEYTDALIFFAAEKFDYLVCPPDVTNELANTVATWVKSQRDSFDKKIKAVLPSVAADHEGVINFDTNNIKAGETTYTNAQYCSRIAGILAGTPLTMAATFTALSEVTDVPRLTKTQADEAINAGKLILYHDGEKVKIARAVNSLVTVTPEKGDAFKKIKIVDIIDMIHNDIKTTVNDNYVGKVSNNYDNKCLILIAIKSYFEQLEMSGVLDKGKSNIEIDIAAQESYLRGQGVDTSALNEYQLKSANTADKVFLASTVKPLDAVEEIKLNVII